LPLWGLVGLCIALLLLAVYWPPLARVLSVEDPGASGWTVAVLSSLAPLVDGQLTLMRRFRERLGTTELESGS
jgi:hypothetical protein